MVGRMAQGPDHPNLRITETRAGGRTVVSAAGELDLATAAGFSATVRECLGSGPVLIDFSELTFMDSSGVRLLDALMRDAESENWSFTICSDLPDNVRQLLEITGMLAGLPMEDR
jgi:anti-anti-sigma factor